MKKAFLSLLVLLVLITVTGIVIFLGRGYKISFNGGRPDLSGTGLLVATSSPDSAQVFVDNHLTTATDDKINLPPGEYTIKIFKEGYFPWTKKVIIDKGVVVKANALLLPTAPKLESITNLGVNTPMLGPSRTKIAYTVSEQSIKKNGVYILDMTSRPLLTLQGASSQITDDTLDKFSSSILTWAPDESEIIASVSAINTISSYLLRPSSFNDSPSDVSATLLSVQSSWEKIKADRERSQMNSLPSRFRSLVMENFKIIAFSDDDSKILYEASASATLPVIVNPRLIGANSTPEDRNIKISSIYVYDVKEDRNYKIKSGLDTDTESLIWLPDSNHLIHVHDKDIDIMEFDGANRTKIYAGPFVDKYVFPWPDSSRIVILTNLGNTNTSPNLYTISLK